MILMIGASGQLGTAVIRRLTSSNLPVRAFVRPTSAARHLRIPNVELAVGDLRDLSTVQAACVGARVIIATANTVIPRGSYSFDADEGVGYRNLVATAEQQGIKQLIFMSVPITPHDDAIPTFRIKRSIERLLMASATPYTIFRGSPFMDEWFALIGSSIPLRGAEAATLRRPFWFSRAFIGGVGHLIEQRGIALVPGSGDTQHSFIALDNVAAFLAKAVNRDDAKNAVFEIGGPQVLSWNDVVALFAKLLGRKIRTVHAPAALFRLQQILLNPFSPAAANLMGLNWAMCTSDTSYHTTALAERFGVQLTSGEEFLRNKLTLSE